MIFEFSDYKLEIDVEKTKSYYNHAPLIHEDCSCDGCRNYEKAVDTLSSDIISFFTQIGVHMKKGREVYVNCANADDTLYYGGFYHICGKILSSKAAWIDISKDVQVRFKEACDLLDDSFPLPAIQLDILIDLPWILQEKHHYPKDNERRKQ